MSNAYKCDICGNFYDDNDIPIATQTANRCNYIKLNNCVVKLVEYSSRCDVDICPNCTAKLQNTVDDILREQIKQNDVGVIDGVVDGVKVNYTKS